MKEKVIVFGAKGMLGSALVPLLEKKFEVSGYSHAEGDITDKEKVTSFIHDFQPNWVVNCAAMTNVDGCEAAFEQATRVNRDGARNIAEALLGVKGGKMVHISTDFVFDGAKISPYVETDPVNPQSVYGKSKEEGERAIWEVLPQRSLIVRTSWVFGLGGKNFVETMLKLAETQKALKVVDDQEGRPTYTLDLSQGLIHLMEVNALGLVHFANSGSCTWNEFARTVFEVAQIEGIDVQKITSLEFKRPAKRPAYSVLSTERYEKLTGQSIRPWKEALQDYIKEREKVTWPSPS